MLAAHVRGEIALPTEALVAEGALERLLPSVGAHVRGEIAVATAPEGADGALERLLPSVGAHVPGELALILEPLGTHLALQLPRAAILAALPLRHAAPPLPHATVQQNQGTLRFRPRFRQIARASEAGGRGSM